MRNCTLLTGGFASSHILFANRVHERERELILKPVQAFDERDLGEQNRTKFPLVVMCLINEDDLDCELNDTDTVGLFAVIHIKDNACPMDTSFVFKLTKIANGQVLNVTNLYTRSESEGEQAACSVCLSNPVEIGLLPCRHFCVCEVCFYKLPNVKRCPICRSYVVKFFRHKTVKNSQGKEEQVEEPFQPNLPPDPEDGQGSSTFSWLSNKFSRLLGTQ